MKHLKHGTLRASQGIALIEALVAILILSIGILGLVGLQASMTRAQGSAKYRGDAAYLASEIIGTMWVDRAHMNSYVITPDTPCTSLRCLDWMSKVSTSLPGGASQISVLPSGDVSISVTWSVSNEGTRSYVLATSIPQ